MVSEWIWCPMEEGVIVKKGEFAGVRTNSVGPRTNINVCMSKGCSCEELERRIEELEGE